MNLSDYLKILSDKKNLSEEEAENLADMLLENNFDETIAGSILTALKVKGESADEIIGFIKSLRKHASNLGIENAIDIVGTGGDGLSTINVSTTVSILLSNLIPVAKHGNRAASSKSGSADFLESLGYNIYIEPNNAANLLKKNNFVFLFAQLYHKSMKNVAIIRKKLGIRSIFNFIGPFANPANVKVQLVGVYPISYLDVLADAASRLNYEKIILINGEPGLDEVSPVGESFIVEVKKDKIDKYKISINDFKVNKVNISNLIVNSPEESAIKVIRSSLGLDKDVETYIRLNTSLGLYLINKVKSLEDGFELSKELLDNFLNRIKEMVSINGNIEQLNKILVKAYGNKN